MTRDQLEHAIRAACSVAEDTEVIVFGSQAILGSYPDAPGSLRASVEVDLQPKNQVDKTDLIDGSLGELSPFHETYGFYIHGVTIDAATLPAGWQDRLVAVRSERGTRGNTGHCLEAHDLAASKLVAFREKDRIFVTTLLLEELIDPNILKNRIGGMPVDDEVQKRLFQWVDKTASELE